MLEESRDLSLRSLTDGEAQMTDEQRKQLEDGDITLQDLEEQGVIDYLDDAEEEENAYVAMDEDEVTDEHTHMEIDPAITHGFSASLTVFPSHNRGDRVNFRSKDVRTGNWNAYKRIPSEIRY